MTFSGRLISYQTYVKYANKYKIDIHYKNGKPKPMGILQKSIYDHETKLINNGKTVHGLYYTK
jgi:CRISPR/Cas system-associated endonuclease Cas1